MATRFADHLLTGTHASRPTATTVPAGTLYACSTHALVYQSDGATWATWATLGSTETLGATIMDAKGDLIGGTAADTAARLAVGTNAQVLTADSAEATGMKWATASAGAVTLLHTLTLGSAGTLDQASISGSYNDLILVVIARANQSGLSQGLKLRFNNDSSAVYNGNLVMTNAATLSSSNAASQTAHTVGSLEGTGASSGSYFSVHEITVFGYASTAWHKAVVSHSFAQIQGSTGTDHMYHQMFGGSWGSTAAVTRVQLASAGGSGFDNLVTGSTLRIYGRL